MAKKRIVGGAAVAEVPQEKTVKSVYGITKIEPEKSKKVLTKKRNLSHMATDILNKKFAWR